ncbi:MAG TPA: FAD:protein FMN transferase [Candidatus Moranbacteria bacterium]|nr:FAD:protein FMN transferase [Candidatus Moranbacteria bacterium]
MPGEEKKNAVSLEFDALGTRNEVRLLFSEGTKEEAQEAAQKIREKFYSFQERFSRFIPESELGFLNGRIGHWEKASPDFLSLAKRALWAYDETKGLFDPRVLVFLEESGYGEDFFEGNFARLGKRDGANPFIRPLGEDLQMAGEKIRLGERMDFGGIAKGFLTDLVATELFSQGWKDFLVDSGGDMYLAGTGEDGKPWRIGLEGLEEQDLQLHLSMMAVATSGISRRKWFWEGERKHHLIDPRSPGRFSFDLRSVSVIDSGVTEAEVWAKALFILGAEKGLSLARRKGLPAIFLTYRSGVLYTPAVKKFL